MAPPKPPPGRNALYKDSIVAQLALQAHFAISDDHPSNKNLSKLAILMFYHVQNAGNGAFKGEYYDVCILFARSNESEMKLNHCTLVFYPSVMDRA